MNNQAPKCEWRSYTMSCGTKRQKLYVNGAETPFFVDSASVAAHRTYGDPHGLWGAGMSEPHWRTGYRIAACFGSSKKISVLKHRAEQMAMS